VREWGLAARGRASATGSSERRQATERGRRLVAGEFCSILLCPSSISIHCTLVLIA
jgi:hypothetical protein